MSTFKAMRSVIICINPESRTLTSTILEAIATDYENGREYGSVFDNGMEVARWLHYEGKLDQIPSEVDILITPTFDCDEVYYADVIRNYNSYIAPTWYVAKTEKRREQQRDEDYSVWLKHYNLNGSLVVKKSGRPFKSGNLCNTVKRTERNPNTGLWGFTFEDDDSVVDIKQLNIVMRSNAPELTGAQQATGSISFSDVSDKSLVIRDYFKTEQSHQNFNKALELITQFMKLKMNKKLPAKYDDLTIQVSYGSTSIGMCLMKDGRYEKEIIPCVDRDDDDGRASVLKRHLAWFDFIKEFE